MSDLLKRLAAILKVPFIKCLYCGNPATLEMFNRIDERYDINHHYSFVCCTKNIICKYVDAPDASWQNIKLEPHGSDFTYYGGVRKEVEEYTVSKVAAATWSCNNGYVHYTKFIKLKNFT